MLLLLVAVSFVLHFAFAMKHVLLLDVQSKSRSGSEAPSVLTKGFDTGHEALMPSCPVSCAIHAHIAPAWRASPLASAAVAAT